jgi:hypothetical protein
MTDESTPTLSDEDIRTQTPAATGASSALRSETPMRDADGTDADGTDGDATDGTDGDSTDGTDGDSTDADGTDR